MRMSEKVINVQRRSNQKLSQLSSPKQLIRFLSSGLELLWVTFVGLREKCGQTFAGASCALALLYIMLGNSNFNRTLGGI